MNQKRSTAMRDHQPREFTFITRNSYHLTEAGLETARDQASLTPLGLRIFLLFLPKRFGIRLVGMIYGSHKPQLSGFHTQGKVCISLNVSTRPAKNVVVM